MSDREAAGFEPATFEDWQRVTEADLEAWRITDDELAEAWQMPPGVA